MRKCVEVDVEVDIDELWDEMSDGARLEFLRDIDYFEMLSESAQLEFLREEINALSSVDLADVVKRRFPLGSAASDMMFRRFIRECGFEHLLKEEANNG
ncbi:MAG: hypothetical protein ACYTBJ_00350 [Planctomycetota bacterium]|jgi:hypothetical protein